MSPRQVYTLVVLWAVGTLFWPYRFCRRWYLRLRLRRKMRALGMIPVLAALWAGTEVAPVAKAVAQAPADSLIGTVLSRSAIGQWDGTVKVYCLTWVSEIPSRPHVLIVVDAVAADTTQHPICPNPEGGYYPMWLDGPTCPPGQVSPFEDRDFVIVRCGLDVLARYRKRQQPDRRAQ